MNIDQKYKGSVLVFSLLILAIMLSAALSVLAVSLAEKRSSSSTRTSVQSFNVAQSGVERVFQAVYKGTALTDLSSLAANSAVNGTCQDGVISIESVAGGSAELTFKDSAGDDIATCTTNVSDIRAVRSLGMAFGTSRAIEAALSLNTTCSGNPKTLALSMAGLGNPAHPRGVAFDTETNSIWVTAGVSSTIAGVVIKIDPVTMTEIGRYPVGQNPQDIVYDPDTKSIWVANYSDGRINKIDVRTGSIVGSSYKVSGGNPTQIAYDPDTKSVWTANYDTNAKLISRISTATGAGKEYSVDVSGNQGIAYDTHTKSVWVTSWSDGSVRSYAYHPLSDTITSGVGASPCPAAAIGTDAYDPITNSIWVACFDSHWVRKVDDISGSMGSRIDITPHSSSPWDVAVDIDNSRIFAAGTGGPLAKIDIASQSFLGNVTDSELTGGTSLTIETYTKSAWVVNTNGNSITKVCLNP